MEKETIVNFARYIETLKIFKETSVVEVRSYSTITVFTRFGIL